MSRGHWISATLAVLAVVAVSPSQAFLHDGLGAGPGWPNRIDDYIDSVYAATPMAPVDIIVDFCSEPMPADSTFLASFGAVYQVFDFIGAIAVRGVTAADCQLIVGYPRVKLIEWDQRVVPHVDVSSRAIQARASTTYPWPAQAAWDINPSRGVMGSGVHVAVLDSGVDDGHPALAGKFIAGYDGFTRQGGPGVNPDDDYAGWFHGTAVAGMIMANDPAQQFMGVAPLARLIDCKVFDAQGRTQSSVVIATIDWCRRNATVYGIDVANMSFGGRIDDGTDALARAADALALAGVTVLASAGNAPPAAGICSPGSGDHVICVGGVTDNGSVPRGDDLFTPFARMGPRASPPPMFLLGFNDLKPEVTAYMVAITTCLGSHPGQGGAGYWQHPGTGTSWATAHASGVAALVHEQYAGIQPAQVDNVLRTTAEARGTPSFPWLDPIYDTQYGWGILSAAAAINTPLPVDVSVNPWTPNNWNSHSIWAGHYPVQVNDPNSLNARVHASGGPAPGTLVTFEAMRAGWGSAWSPVGATTVNVPWGGSTVATIAYTPPPGMEGHKCFRVRVSHPADVNPANNEAQENIDIQAARGLAAAPPAGVLAGAFAAGVGRDGRELYTFALLICVEPSAPFWRTADACICAKDLPAGAQAWLVPEPPFDLMPGQCQPCELHVEAPPGVTFAPGHAVYVNGWFWGNGIAEGGVAIHFAEPPAIETTIREVQYTEDPTGPSPLVDQRVTVAGIATAGDATYPGRYAIQDGRGPWSGIFVVDNGLSAVARGDSLVVSGRVIETGGLTEIDPAGSVAVHSSGHDLPPAELLDPGVIDGSEAYEGVLVRVEDVEVVDAGDPADWQVAGNGTCWVGRWGGYTYLPVLGDSLDVTGIVGSLDDLYKLQPRDDADIQAGAAGVGAGEGDLLPFSLAQNRPNPAGPLTGIAYTLPQGGRVRLRVFGVNGRLVRTLVDGPQPAGRWRIHWDGLDDAAHPVSSGVYFYTLEADGRTIARQMVLAR